MIACINAEKNMHIGTYCKMQARKNDVKIYDPETGAIVHSQFTFDLVGYFFYYIHTIFYAISISKCSKFITT